MKPYLDKLQAQYSKITAELADKKADFEIAHQDEVKELEKKMEELRTKMDELQHSSEDKMDDLKGQSDKLMGDIQSHWNVFLEKLKR